MKLTIGMATHNDFSGVYFTVQALRMFHNLNDCEILIVDNYGDTRLEQWVSAWGRGQVRYEKYTDIVGTSAPRHMVFELARGEYVICIDSHVILRSGAIDRLWEDDSLIHGPMLYDDGVSYVKCMNDVWRSEMWGIWDDVAFELPAEPFEIWGHGLGLFGSRKDTWLGFNDKFRGFGGEEGYIHEKYRKAGRKVMCLPWMVWQHRFGYEGNYPLNMSDRVRNYVLGFQELGRDEKDLYDHFGRRIVDSVKEKL